MSARFPYVVVHGRFQPLHNEHMAYFRWALTRGERLVIGITNFDRASIEQEATCPHRHTEAANPFTYWERTVMIRDALLQDGVAPDRFSIVALPIHAPDCWPQYVPTDPASSVHALRIFSAWEEEKVSRMQKAGYRVAVVRGDVKHVSASEVRDRIARDQDWQDLVPSAVGTWIEEINGVARIKTLQARDCQRRSKIGPEGGVRPVHTR